jgi:hypothetical protein
MVADITPPVNAPLRDEVLTTQQVADVATQDDLACVIDRETNLLLIYRFAAETWPEELGSVAVPGYLNSVAMQGDLAFVAAGFGGTQIVDIQDPTAPVLVGSGDPYCYPQDVLPAGNLLYVADDCGLRVVDVSLPSAPEYIGFVDTPGSARALAGGNGYVYAATSGGTDLQIINVHDPGSPWIAHAVSLPIDARSLYLDGSYIFVGGWSGTWVVDVSEPTEAFAVNSLPGAARAMVQDGPFLYMARYYSIEILDISDVLAPVHLGTVIPPHPVNGMAALPDRIITACSSVVTLGKMCALPTAVNIDQRAVSPFGGHLVAEPNPFNPQTSLRFELARDQHVLVDAYDVAGRHIARVAEGRFAAGRQVVRWDGRDETGRELPSGTYVLRLSAEEGVRAAKVAIVR